MKFLIFFLFILFDVSFSISQGTGEVIVSLSTSIFSQDKIIGSTLKFEDNEEGSNINLRNTLYSGVSIQFQKSFHNGRFFYFGQYVEDIVRYETRIYHPKYGKSEEFNNFEIVEFKNTNVQFSLGLFARMNIYKKNIQLDLGFQVLHRHFRDSEIIHRKNANPDFQSQKSGDLEYEVKLNYHSINQRIVVNPFMLVNFKLSKNIYAVLRLSSKTPFKLNFNSTVFGYSKIQNNPIVGSWSGQNYGQFGFSTKAISLSLGIKFYI